MKKITLLLFFMASVGAMAQNKVFDTITFIRGGKIYKLLLYSDHFTINENTYYPSGLSSVSGTLPLTLGLTGGALTGSIAQANTTTNGYLSSTDWNTFNNKISSQWTTSGSNIYYTSGNVGIGVTAPAHKLDVLGRIKATQNTYREYAIFGSATNGATGVGGSATDWYGVYGSSTSSHGGHFSSDNSYGVYGYSQSVSGIYGLGNPGVTGSSGSGTGVYGTSTSGAGVYGSSSAGNQFYFGNDRNSTKDSAMVMTSGGKVGIGKTNPTAMLDVAAPVLSINGISATSLNGYGIQGTTSSGGAGVYGLGNLAGSRGVDGYSANGIGVVGGANSGTGGTFSSSSGTSLIANSQTGFQFKFGYDRNNDNDSIMMMNVAGNVGIGKTNPVSKLDVSGVITATGGSSTNWNTAYGWGNHSGLYVPTAMTISTTAPLAGGGALSSNLTLSIPSANTSTSGYLTSTDWNTFNNKFSSQWQTIAPGIRYRDTVEVSGHNSTLSIGRDQADSKNTLLFYNDNMPFSYIRGYSPDTTMMHIYSSSDIFIDPVGSVKIGYLNQDAKFCVTSFTNPIVARFNNGDDEYLIGNLQLYDPYEFGLYYSICDLPIAVFDKSNDFVRYGRSMIVDNGTGSVGIGTTGAASSELEVVGTITTPDGTSDDWNAMLSSQWSDESYGISYNDTVNIHGIDPTLRITADQGQRDSKIEFWDQGELKSYIAGTSSDVSGMEIYSIDNVNINPLGNVGIGTGANTPASKLEVVGTVTVKDNIKTTAIPATDHSASGDIMSLTAGATNGIGDVIFIASTGKTSLCKADAISNCPYALAVCIESVSANASGQYLTKGVARDDTWNWTIGGLIYVSTTGTTGNTLTQTAPSASNNVIIPVAIALTADIIYFFGNTNTVEKL